MRIIETKALSRSFGTLKAVDDLNVAVAEGEVFGLLGPNGAGKTTTIKMLTTLLPPTSGEARVDGHDIVTDSREVRKVIGYVPQMLSAEGSLTAYENLLIFAKIYGLPKAGRDEKILEALKFMGLEEAKDRQVRTFSGGMIRRLEIAQSTLHSPKLLFLDEPTVGLDPGARHAVWDMVSRLKETVGTTVFLTTHLMEEADFLCDRVGIMHRGKLVALGSPKELKESIGAADLDEVFIHFAGEGGELTGSYREVDRIRKTARRLG
ncbi:MAG: ATP-binding cassette domain-containing protein [Methanomassiliicoccales archaeon]|nr:ATP-binding cassette domain-containing protein [Methanomassiliicoccales archaeon]